MYQWNTIIFSSFQVLKIRMEVWNQRDPMITYWNASWKLINIVFNENADLDNGFVTAVFLENLPRARYYILDPVKIV